MPTHFLHEAMAVQYKKRFWLFGPMDEMTGLRPLLCRPSPAGFSEDEAKNWALRKSLAIVSFKPFHHMKPIAQSFCDVLEDMANELSEWQSKPKPEVERYDPFQRPIRETVIDESGEIIDG